ncbi:hypothetical protein RQ832_30550, partial [Roseomonas sp. DSM 102946]|nr:hypothetical protein [Roseomonas sp. DSM 102946]
SRDWVIAWQLPVYLQERTLEVYEPQTWLAQAEGFLPDGIQAQLGLMSRHVFMIIPARPSDQYACAAITGASFSLRLT